MNGIAVLDLDASAIPTNSGKEGAEPNFKGYGHHPLLMFRDNTEELLVNRRRPGSAGSNTADDHISVSIEGLRQLPTRRRRQVLFRTDGAGATREFLARIASGGGNTANRWEYSVGHTRDDDFWKALAKVPSHAWTPALDHKGQPRKDADLVEITDMPDPERWPDGMRVIVRRAPVHPEYEREPKDDEKKTDYRYQAIATNTEGGQLQFLDARARSHTRVEAGIRRGKALSLNLMPSKYFKVDQAWCTLLALATDLARWFRLPAVSGKLSRAEPATLRTRLLDVPAKLADHARRREWKLDPAWPASTDTVDAWDTVQAPPDPG